MAKRAANPVPLDRLSPELSGPALTQWIVATLVGGGGGTNEQDSSSQPSRRGLGFDLAGVCDAIPVAHQREVLAWLGAGKHGEMDYLLEQIEPRLAPELELARVKSVIMAGAIYQPAGKQKSRDTDEAQPMGLVAR